MEPSTPGWIWQDIRLTTMARPSMSVDSEASAYSYGFGMERTNARNLPLWPEGLHRRLESGFEIGGGLHHQSPKANRSRLACFLPAPHVLALTCPTGTYALAA